MERPTDLGFAYRVHKSGDVTISRHGRTVTVLRGAAAGDFAARVLPMTPGEQQAAMARVTGHYRQGNERAAARHPRNR